MYEGLFSAVSYLFFHAMCLFDAVHQVGPQQFAIRVHHPPSFHSLLSTGYIFVAYSLWSSSLCSTLYVRTGLMNLLRLRIRVFLPPPTPTPTTPLIDQRSKSTNNRTIKAHRILPIVACCEVYFVFVCLLSAICCCMFV
jgi:hypothetical protein